MEILEKEYYAQNLETLESGIKGKVSYSQKFCKELHDLSRLIHLNVYPYNHDKDYERTKWRHYYFFMFALIYENATTEDVDSLVAELHELFDNIENTAEELETAGSELSYVESNSIGLATLEAIKLAQFDYLTLKSMKYMTTKHLQEVESIESKIKIRKNESDGLWLLKPWFKTAKSKTTRWRHFKNPEVANTRKAMTQSSEADAKRVVKEFYKSKISNPSMTIKEFISLTGIPRSTFFKYKNMVDINSVLNNTERAYLSILNEKHVNPTFTPTKTWADANNVSYDLAKKYVENID